MTPFAPVLSMLALAVASCPRVVTCHASGSPRLYPLGGRVFRPIIPRIDYRIAVSEEARTSAEPYVGRPFEVIPNGVALPDGVTPGRTPSSGHLHRA
jgi:phosphatidylinositol alpha-mannosyltransferase